MKDEVPEYGNTIHLRHYPDVGAEVDTLILRLATQVDEVAHFLISWQRDSSSLDNAFHIVCIASDGLPAYLSEASQELLCNFICIIGMHNDIRLHRRHTTKTRQMSTNLILCNLATPLQTDAEIVTANCDLPSHALLQMCSSL